MSKLLKTAAVSAVLFCIITAAHAADPKVSIKFTADELALSINIFNSIELRGDEVGPFIDIKDLLIKEYKDLSSDKKKTIEVDFTLPMAKNFLFFMQRGKLKGAEAAVFNSISTKTVEAIKKETK